MALQLTPEPATVKWLTPPASWTNSIHNKYAQIFNKYVTKLNRRQNTSRRQRQRPALWDICNGAVLWLPAKHAISHSILCKFPKLFNLHPGAFDHPIMVLDVAVTSPEDAVVTFAPMTSGSSMRHTSGQSKLRRWGPYMKVVHKGHNHSSNGDSSNEDDELEATSAMSNTSVTDLDCAELEPEFEHSEEPCNSALLFSENETLYLDCEETLNRTITKSSYVDLSAIYSIEWQELQCYAANQKPNGYRYRLQKESFEKLATRMHRPASSWVESDQLWETFYENNIKPLEDDQGWTEVKGKAAASRKRSMRV